MLRAESRRNEKMMNRNVEMAKAKIILALTVSLSLCTTPVKASTLPVQPVLNCSTNSLKGLKPCHDMKVDCANNAIATLMPCLTFLEGSEPFPSPKCCSAVTEVAQNNTACLCHVTFYPPEGISLVLQQAMPVYCNVTTTKMCEVCPGLLRAVPEKSSCSAVTSKKGKILASVAVCVTILLVVFLAVCIWLACRRKKRAWRFPDSALETDEILKIEGRPTLYTYNVLKVATKNFHPACKLGEGGFGSVYKGVLPDGAEVAVKKLSASSRQGKEEFLNEVHLITGVQHRNLVKLRGCCLKGDERLLVYEYLENKSLNQALFEERNDLKMDWQARLKILVGTARGLAYLHEGCQTRIIHRDIKASNILLDRDLNPKIADFGLARFFLDDQSHVSTRVAGTVGYLAPEYAMRGQLTEKADVFSFGIVALELVSGRGNLDLRLPNEQAYLLDWTWQLHEDKKLMDLVDPSTLDGSYNQDEALRVIEVALLCTQSVASMRPAMSRVVTMLTGEAEIEIPEISKPRLRLFTDGKAGGTSERTNSSYDSRKNFSDRSTSHGSHGSLNQSSMTSSNAASYISTLEPR